MTPMQVAQRITAEEYLANPPDARWSELIDGVVVVNEPRPRHGLVHARLVTALTNWTRDAPRRGAAIVPLDVRMDDHNVYAPDIVWYADGRVPGLDDPGPHAVPQLAVEIRSPSTWRYDVGTKKSVYETGGLPELWLVDTAARIVLVYRRSGRGRPRFDVAEEVNETLTSPALPGFSLALGDLFP